MKKEMRVEEPECRDRQQGGEEQGEKDKDPIESECRSGGGGTCKDRKETWFRERDYNRALPLLWKLPYPVSLPLFLPHKTAST